MEIFDLEWGGGGDGGGSEERLGGGIKGLESS